MQVGITLASLSLGYLGEITLEGSYASGGAILQAVGGGAHARLALVFAFGLLTILQVVLGELVPKNLSLAQAERVALLVARPFHWFLNSFSWAIDLLDGFAEKMLHALGVTAPHDTRTCAPLKSCK